MSPFQAVEHKIQPPSCIFRWMAKLEDISEPLQNPYAKTCGSLEAFVRSLVAGTKIFLSEFDRTGKVSLGDTFQAWTTATYLGSSTLTASNGSQETQLSTKKSNTLGAWAASFRRHALQCLDRRSFVIMANGYIGLAPDSALEGDVVALIGGSSTPICLRRDNGRWQWIGAVYLHDVMHGELINKSIEANDGGLKKFEIH